MKDKKSNNRRNKFKIGLHVQIDAKTIIGNNVELGDFAIVSKTTLEDYVGIGRNSIVEKSYFARHSYVGYNAIVENTEIGKFSSISWNTTISAARHPKEYLSQHEFLYERKHNIVKKGIYDPHPKKVIIGNDVWIGANAIVMPGITISDGAIVGAGAVVTKDVPAYAIVAGIPAKIIKYRFSPAIIRELLKIKWWNLPDDFIIKNIDLFSNKIDKQRLEDLKARIDKYKKIVILTSSSLPANINIRKNKK